MGHSHCCAQDDSDDLIRNTQNPNEKEIQVIMVGLDGTGKKTILDRLQPNPIPSIKRYLVVLEYKNISFNVYNVGTGGKNQLLGPLWKHLYPTTQGIIYVVDSSDREAIEKRAKKG
eukprot:313826_1